MCYPTVKQTSWSFCNDKPNNHKFVSCHGLVTESVTESDIRTGGHIVIMSQEEILQTLEVGGRRPPGTKWFWCYDL